jgi:thiazole synthase ThiGH ThiG subunit
LAGLNPKEKTMDAIVDVVAQVLLLGSLALLVWGAMLTAGQLVRAAQARSAAEEAGNRGEDRRHSPRAGFAAARRGRFSRLAPPA